MEKYQEFLCEQLAKRIADTGTEVCPSNLTDVLMKSSVLYKELPVLEFGQPTGEVYRYLSKTDKVMVLRMVSLTASLLSTAKWNNDSGTIYAEASLYFDRNDTRPVAQYNKTFSIERMMGGVPTEGATIEQRAQAEQMARGICETRCLSRFGIGEWEDEEDPESALRKSDEKSGFAPVIVTPENPQENPSPVENQAPQETSVEVAETLTEAKAEAAEADTTTTPPTEEAKAPAAKRTAKKTKAKADSSMSLEEARAVKADIGIAARNGFTLGDVEEKQILNLRYLYNKSESVTVKTAIRVIAAENQAVAKIFDEAGIVL